MKTAMNAAINDAMNALLTSTVQIGHFIKDDKPLKNAPVWGMTLLKAGSMRFRWSETNARRDEFFASLCGTRQVAAVELVHSKTVLLVENSGELLGKKADGVLTANPCLIPTVTVADCMPLFVYDSSSGVFGVLHSGWRGTGIISEAYSLLRDRFCTKPEELCVVLGAHIKSCCYCVDKERAALFKKSFGDQCAKEAGGSWYLDLQEANLALLERIGVPRGNVYCVNECTACFTQGGQYKYGSFRRQTAQLSADVPLDVRLRAFTAQAAFVMMP